MAKRHAVHKNEPCAYKDWRFALCGSLGGSYLERVIVVRWAKVTCKRCLRMAPKAVKVRLGIP
jgi:hypothetical protein